MNANTQPSEIQLNPQTGLTTAQVRQRIAEKQQNKIKKVVGKSYLAIFTTNILTFFNLLGIIIFILMLFCGSVENMVFFVIILLNTMIGIFQEIRSKISVEKLALLQQPTAEVLRDGKLQEISKDDIVLSDIVKYSAGKQICADGVVLDGQVEVNESLLTGESYSIKKSVGDELFAGSFVVSGSCQAETKKVGQNNYIQQLTAKVKKFKKPNSELMRSIQKIIKVLSWIIFPLGLATLLTSNYDLSIPYEFQDALKVASGSMIGMVPSGMVLLTSVALAVSMFKLGRKNVLVQELYCIEMLARVDTLCIDKTGTITDGSMTVEKTVILDKSIDDKKLAQYVASLLEATKDQNLTACALSNFFKTQTTHPATISLAFSSKRKYSAASFDEIGTIAVGAGEFMFEVDAKTAQAEQKYLEQGLRVLYVAKSDQKISDDGATGLKPLAMILLQDTVRSDAAEIISWFKQNNVAVKVISGDNPLSVSVIAKKVGIENAEKYISLAGMSDQEVMDCANNFTVFGRVSPEQKALLIKSMKQNDHTVAMMGDGVNDILAMRESDCSISVACGSDAAKNVAQLVLTDNKFQSMPMVVAEGRQVVNNIQNSSSLFLMKTTMTVLTTIFLLFFGNHPYPFQAQHLYAVEFFVNGIPSFLLALKPNKSLIKGKFIQNVMKNTLPSGVAMFLAVAMTYIFMGVLGISKNTSQISTVAMFCMTATAVVALIILMIPYDKFNYLIAAISTVGTIGCFLVFPPLLHWLSMTLTGNPPDDALIAQIPTSAIWFIAITTLAMSSIVLITKLKPPKFLLPSNNHN